MTLRRVLRPFVLLIPALVAGCGLFDFEEREPWRAQAEAACFARGMVRLSPLIQPVSAIEGNGICGLDRPLRVTALADGSVRIGDKGVVMSCPMTAALESWVRETVMPAAYERYGMPVVEIRQMGTYACRSRNNVRGARLSEHAFANAFDFAGVVLADGRTVTVKTGWRGPEADRAFLRQIHAGACGPFTTVLGPGSDGMHENHLHLDLARHDVRGTRRYCRPTPQAPAPGAFPSYPPAGPGEVPMASAPPAGWPRVLPQSIEAAERNGPPPLLPPAPIACPPGYICMPAASVPQPTGPAALGWQAGPAGVDRETETGTLGYRDF